MAERAAEPIDPRLREFLVAQRLAAPGEDAQFTPLAGGVSSDIWRVDLGGRSLCLKRALARLRVNQSVQGANRGWRSVGARIAAMASMAGMLAAMAAELEARTAAGESTGMVRTAAALLEEFGHVERALELLSDAEAPT